MMEKPKRVSGYSPAQTERAEQLLLEIWSYLGDYHEYLALVGGLVPWYLVPQNVDRVPKYCGTTDIDLAVSMGVADVNAYASIRQSLERIGLQPGVNPRGNEQRHSFMLDDSRGPVIVDFLTTRYDGPAERVRAVHTQLSAIQVEGLGLALVEPAQVTLKGRSLRGGVVEATLRVCRPIPFVVLKALAFDNRREGKDVHDLVYILQHADGGASSLARTVRKEEIAADAFQHAISTLKANFAGAGYDGPIRYSQFVPDVRDATSQAFAAVQEFLESLDL